MPCEVSVWASTAPGSASSKEGHPVPESNLVSEEKSLLPQAAHVNVPSASACRYSPVKGGSVPFSRSARYCSGVSVPSSTTSPKL
jgi:hypothetical protein